jgi:hypothetical protein
MREPSASGSEKTTLLVPWSSVGTAGAGCGAGICGSGGRVSCSALLVASDELVVGDANAVAVWASKLTEFDTVGRSAIAASRAAVEDCDGDGVAEAVMRGPRAASAPDVREGREEMKLMRCHCDARLR